MKICLVSQEFPPDTGWGGIGTYTYEMAQGLVARGHEVHVVSKAVGKVKTHQHPNGLIEHRIRPPISISKVPMFWRLNRIIDGYHLAVVTKLLALARKSSLDIVESPALHGEAVYFQKLVRRLPTIVRIHSCIHKAAKLSGLSLTPTLLKSHFYERHSVQLAHLVTAPSRSIVRDNRQYLPLARRDVSIIANPIDTWRFQTCQSIKCDTGGVATVLFVGRLTPLKGADVLARSMLEVWCRYPDVRLLYVGPDGVKANGQSMREWIIQSIPESKQSQVIFSGSLTRNKIPQQYAQATVVAFPSLSESFGYVCLESMAAGKPIVATRSGGPEEVVIHNQTGLLVAPDDHVALADAINTLLDNPELRRTMGENGRQLIQERYQTPVIVKQMEEVFAKAVR